MISSLSRVIDSIRRFIDGGLKLKVNLKKSAVDSPWKSKFLGLLFTSEKTFASRGPALPDRQGREDVGHSKGTHRTTLIAVGPDVVGLDAQQPDAALAKPAGAVDVDDVHRLATSEVALEIAEHGYHLELVF